MYSRTWLKSWVVTFVSPTLTCHSKRRSWCRSSKLNAEPKACTSSCRIPEGPGSQAQSVRTCLPSPQAGQLRKELRKHGVELHIATLLHQRLVYPHHPYIALRCPITRCRSGSVPLPPVVCSIWSSKGKGSPFPPLAWSLDGTLSTCPSSDYCFTSSHLDGPIFSIPHWGLRRHDSQPSADTPAEANDITLVQDIVAEVFDAIAECDSGKHLWWLPACSARGARVFNFFDPRMDSLFSAPRVMPKGRTALPALRTSSMLGNLGWRWRWACDGMRWACDSTHALAHTDAHTFDLPILPLESWRFLGTTDEDAVEDEQEAKEAPLANAHQHAEDRRKVPAQSCEGAFPLLVFPFLGFGISLWLCRARLQELFHSSIYQVHWKEDSDRDKALLSCEAVSTGNCALSPWRWWVRSWRRCIGWATQIAALHGWGARASWIKRGPGMFINMFWD